MLGARLDEPTVRLRTGAGVIAVQLTREGERIVFGEMEQPIPSWEPFARADELMGALGVSRSGVPIEVYRNGPVHVCVTLGSKAAVASLRPDLGALAEFGSLGVSCFAAGEREFKTRMFAPSLGVAEDL